MSFDTRKSLRNLPTTHYNCRMITGGLNGGIARPGKTARDRDKAFKNR